MSNLIKSHIFVGQDKRVLQIKAPAHQAADPISIVDKKEEYQEALMESKEMLEKELTLLKDEYQQIKVKWTEEEQAHQLKLEQLRLEEQKRIEEEATTRWQKAEQEGYQQGYDAAYQKLEIEYQQKLEKLSQITKVAYQEKEKIIQEAEPSILQLSLSIAERILHAEIDLAPEKIIIMIQEALKEVSERGDIIIQVSPEDYLFLQENIEDLKMYVDSNSSLKIIADYKQQGAGCMIHTLNGSYDVIIDHQLEELKKQLLQFAKEGLPS